MRSAIQRDRGSQLCAPLPIQVRPIAHFWSLGVGNGPYFVSSQYGVLWNAICYLFLNLGARVAFLSIGMSLLGSGVRVLLAVTKRVDEACYGRGIVDGKTGDYFRQLLLQEARSVSQEALDRLKELHDRYPADLADLPEELIEALRKVRLDYHSEQRASPRLPSGGVRVRLCRAETAEWLEEALVLDEGQGGVGVLCERPLPVGSIVCLSPGQDADVLPPCQAEVRHCCRRERAWAIGCQFLPAHLCRAVIK